MIRTVILTLSFCGWTLEHILDDGDHCSLAQSCAHDGAEARGIDADGRTVRLFLDACDMHEYNCDQGTSFKLVTAGCSSTAENEVMPTEPTLLDSDHTDDYNGDDDNNVQTDDEHHE